MDDVQFELLISYLQAISAGFLYLKACLGVGFGLVFGWIVVRDVLK